MSIQRACMSHDDTANASASRSKKPITCRPSGKPPSWNRGSDSDGTPSSEDGTPNSGLPVELRPLGRGARCGERDAAVAQRGKLTIDGADAGAFFEIGAVIGKRQMIVLVGALPRDWPELAGVAVAHGAEEPLALKAVDAMRQLGDVRQFGFERRDLLVVVARPDVDAGRFQPRHAFIEAVLGAGRGRAVPAGGFKHRRAHAASWPPAPCPGLACPACRRRRRRGQRSRGRPARRPPAMPRECRCSSGSDNRGCLGG